MTKAWFKLAIRDLKTSKQLIDLGPEYKHAAAYFAQQCSEKAIKGFLTSNDCRVPKTHDLEILGKVADSVNKSMSKFILKYKALTELAIAYRYPDAAKRPLTMARAKSASKQAHLIYDKCYKATYGKPDKSKIFKSFKDL